MTNNGFSPIDIEEATEQLRQERETFDQQKTHENRWFFLRLIMGYSSIILLTAVMVVSSYILFNNTAFPSNVVVSAGGALFVDVLGLLIGVWKIVLNPNFLAQLKPITNSKNKKTRTKQ